MAAVIRWLSGLPPQWVIAITGPAAVAVICGFGAVVSVFVPRTRPRKHRL